MSDFTDLIARTAKLEALFAKVERHGIIRKGDKGKYRIQIGLNADGTPHLSPWLFPGQHAGFKREDVPFREGQNVTVSMPTGDPRQARIIPYSPNDANPRPVHASNEAATVQIPHIDKDGKEETDKNKPGFQRTENSKERTTAFDKKSSHSQTAEKISHEVKEAWDGKAKALLEQTFGKVSRLLDGGKGVTSLLEHEVEKIFHRVGDKVSHLANLSGFVRDVAGSKMSHGAAEFLHQIVGNASSLRQGPAGFIRLVGSSMMSHGPGQILHSLGSVQHLLSGSGILGQFGGIQHLLSSAGNLFSGGFVTHDGADIGKSHQHMVPGPFGMILSMVPQLLGGGSQGGGGYTPPPPGTGGGMGPPSPIDLTSAAAPFAWGGVMPGGSGIVPVGNVFGLAFTGDTTTVQVAFLKPTGGPDYRIHATDETGRQLKISGRTVNGFQVQADASSPITRLAITVFP